MKKLWISGFAACLALFMSSGVFAQDFEFVVAGPDSYIGPAGSEQVGEYIISLPVGDAPGPQGWSLGVWVEGGVPMSPTTDGTDAEGLFKGGFDATQVIDPERNDGREGVTSGVVLCFQGCEGVMLPADTESSILKLGVVYTIPAGDGVAAVSVIDGLSGDGQPVVLNVTVAGESLAATGQRLEITLIEEITCCGAAYNLGFSGERLLNNTPGEGIIDATETCNAIGSLDASGATSVFVNIVSDGEVPVQGWSFSIEVTGDIVVTDVTLENTSGNEEPDGRESGGFLVAEIAGFETNDPRRGAIAAVVLCFQGCGGVHLDPVGTESGLQIKVDKADPEAETASGDLFFEDGLFGSGQPVQNNLVISGASGKPCNQSTARLTVNIAPPAAVGPYRPGDSNDDGQVDIADPVWTINAMFQEGPASPCELAADSNGDRLVDLADVTYTIAYEFMGGPAPVDGLECATIEVDAAGDLTCDNSSCSE